MVATTSTNSYPQSQCKDMSSIESGCVENVFFTVKDLYTGKRTLRQVKHEEISKVSFVLGQLATQNVIVKELMFLICALIGDIPLSESISPQGQPFPSAPTLSTAEGTSQKSSEQVTSPINESLPEPNLSDSPASNLPKRKILRPRATQKDVEQTSHSKTKSRKRNIFTEDEADEDERERCAIRTRSKASRGSKEFENSLSKTTNLTHPEVNENTTMTGSNDQSFNSALASPQQTPSNGINSSFQSQYQATKQACHDGNESYFGNASGHLSNENDINNMDVMMSVQQIYEPIVITSAMIEATDDDYDEPDPPSVPSPPPTEIIGNHNLNQITSHHATPVSPVNQEETHNISETQHESHNCDLCVFSTSSLDTMKHHSESNHPLIAVKEEKIRSCIPNEPIAQIGKRESRRISDIKRETSTNTDQPEGCETTHESQKVRKSPKGKERDITIDDITINHKKTKTLQANVTLGGLESPRAGAPHYCEICGKHFDGKNRTTSRVAHMAHAHFKDKLLSDLVDKTPPFRCPALECSYQTRERDKWSRHYGSVHGLIKKYLKQYFEENPGKTRSSPSPGKSSSMSPNSLLSPLSASVEESFTATIGHVDEVSPSVKVTGYTGDQKVKEKYILKKNLSRNERRRKIRKSNGSSIFKRKQVKFRNVLNKKEGKKTQQLELAEEDKKEDESEDKTDDNVRCKYSSGKENGLEKCSGCGVGYSSNSALKRHYESVHLRIKKAQCPYCPVRMSQRHNLRNHINAIHLNNKRHQCKICQFSCWKKPDFERHLQKHEEGGENIEKSNDSTNIKHEEITIEEHTVEEEDHSTPNSSKTKKGLTAAKYKRRQRKKHVASTNEEDKDIKENNHHASMKHANTRALAKPSRSYPSFVIKKRIGCGRSGLHRKAKPRPKIPPKLTVVISKVDGQIIAKQKDEGSVKLETSLSVKSTNLGRKSLESQLAESVMKGPASDAEDKCPMNTDFSDNS